MTLVKSSIQKKSRTMLMNRYHTLSRTVLIEKVPFKVLSRGDVESGHFEIDELLNSTSYVVRNCVSIKEMINGLARGMELEDKRLYVQRIMHKNFRPNEFYIVVKGFVNKEKGLALFKKDYIKASKFN